MAIKRMFAKKVVETQRFRDMSRAARLLYYDLGMAADDDGVAEGKQVLLCTGAKKAHLEELEACGYVRLLDEHLAVRITDWNVNNNIRRDRYRPGEYADACPADDGQTEDGQTADGGQTDDGQTADSGQTDDGQTADGGRTEDGQAAAQYSIDKLSTVQLSADKDREEKVREERPEGPRRAERFTPPTPEEVGAYVLERGSNVDPQRFVDFYASKGWRVGSQPMKDWRAAVRTWERREDRGGGPGPVPSEADYREGW